MFKKILILTVSTMILGFGSGTWAEDSKSYQVDSINQGNYADAEKRLLSVLEADANDPFALLNLAFIYQRYNEHEKARAMYERILNLKDNPHAELASGKAEKVKTIAQKGIALLDTQ